MLVTLLSAGIAILALFLRGPGIHSESQLSSAASGAGPLLQPTSPSGTRVDTRQRSAQRRTAPAVDPDAVAALSSNKVTHLVYSNIVVKMVTVPGAMEKLVGTQEFEEMSKRDYEDKSAVDPALVRLKDMLEAEGVPDERLYSAIRVVYEMRSTQKGSRFLEFYDRQRHDVALIELKADTIHSEADKALIRNEQVDFFNADELAREVTAKELVDRVKAKLHILTGGVSEATFERFYSLEPRF
jgi:hypothetical protein